MFVTRATKGDHIKLSLVKEGKIPYILIYQTERDIPSVCVLAESIEFSLFLIPKTSSEGNYLRIGTIICYGKDIESKIEKQKLKGSRIDSVKEVF